MESNLATFTKIKNIKNPLIQQFNFYKSILQKLKHLKVKNIYSKIQHCFKWQRTGNRIVP